MILVTKNEMKKAWVESHRKLWEGRDVNDADQMRALETAAYDTGLYSLKTVRKDIRRALAKIIKCLPSGSKL